MRMDPALLGQTRIYEQLLGRPLATRETFIRDLAGAVREARPFGASRAGISEEYWMYYPILLESGAHPAKIKAFEKLLRFNGYRSAGIFPASADFYLRYNERYIQDIRELDVFGMILEPVMGPEILKAYGFRNQLIYFKDLIPDRSTPADPERCYLHHFQGKRLLIVCPFADLLRQRANRETFEGVWSRIGKKWFWPASVDALEFPYGFSAQTHDRYGHALNLLDAITTDMARKSFDVALIAAAGLSVPLVAAARRMGKTAVSLGGDLQVLFGVIGQRWRDNQRWRNDYFNSWWIDMPAAYRPNETEFCGNSYW